MNELDRLKYDALSRQLERTRQMQQTYVHRGFQLLLISGLLTVISLVMPGSVVYLLLPFVAVSLAMLAAYYLHYIRFARRLAAAVEEQINGLLGEKLLRQGELEEDYFLPVRQPLSGELSVKKAPRFALAFVLHCSALWLLILFWCCYNLFRVLRSQPGVLWTYLVLLVAWTTVHLTYLYYHFQDRREARVLEERLGQGTGTNSKGW